MYSTRLLLISLVCFAWVGLVACGDNLGAGGPSAITLTPSSVSVAAGETTDVTASYTLGGGKSAAGTDVTWTVADAAIATVTPGANGRVTVRGVKPGMTMLMAAGRGATGVAVVTVLPAVLRSIAITPTAPSVAAGTSVQLTATGTYSDATTADLSAQVTWASSATAVASVSATGLFKGLTAGNATITATFGRTVATTNATVTAATLTSIQVTPTTPSLALGTTAQLTATGMFSDATTQDLTTQVTWTSGTVAKVTVSAGGLATAVALGTSTITATKGAISGTTTVTATAAVLASLAITPAAPSLARGRTLQLTATGTFTDNTTQDLTAQVTWVSGTPAVAAVSATGLATALELGPSTITATLGAISGSTVLTVTAAVLVSIDVTPTNPSVPLGRTQQLTATGTFSDATTQDLTGQVGWASTDTTIVQVSNAAGSQGLATTLKIGATTVSATLGAVSGSTALTVTAAVLNSIAVTPTNSSVALGRTQQFTATGTFTDLTTQDLTTQVTWTSGTTAIATVSNAAGSQGLATTLQVGASTIRATLGAISGSTALTVTAAVLVSIDVTPTAPSLALGRTQQLTATGRFSDATTQDLTSQVAWASTDTTIVQVSNAAGTQGLATTLKVGATTVSATLGAVSGSTTLTVTAAVLDSIAVTPTNPSVALGRTQQFTATGTFSDLTTQDLTTQVTWTSGTTAIATVSNAAGSQGLATTLQVGASTISAGLGAISGSTTLTVTAAVVVSIAVTPTNPSVARGRTLQFTATGTFSDATTQDLTGQVTWTSSDATLVQVSNAAGSRGLATTLKVGTATVTATLGAVSGSSSLTVTAAVLDSILVTPTNPSVALGFTQQFTATGVFSDLTTQDLTTQVTWTSGAAIAAVSNAAGSQGLATTLLVGTTAISATLGAISGSTELTVTAAVVTSIAVTPTTPSVARGRTLQFTAIGTFSDLTTQDLTTQVTWTSATTTVAAISNAAGSQGLATAVQVGTSTIRATLGAVSGATTLTVTAAVLDSIQVTPVAPSNAAGTIRQFTATGTFSDLTTQDLTTQVTWASSDPAVATISNALGSHGLATTLSAGTTTISATLGAVSGTTTLTVTDAVVVSIQVTPVDPTLALGRTLAFTATGTFSDATTQDLTTQVTWVSADPTNAVISNAAGFEGVATALALGTTAISATFSGVTGSTTLTVTAAVLDSITVTPADASVAKGRTQQFTATGTFSDTTTQDLTTQVTWASSDPAVAAISNALGAEGLATTLTTGTTTISATIGAVSGATTLTVTNAVVVSIQVTPVNPSVASGRTQQFTAIGTFSDATTQDLTAQVTWVSADRTIAAISNAAGSQGLATALAVGATPISATVAGVTGSTTLTVTAAVLDSITVIPANISLAKGRTQQFTAIGTFSDASTQDLTTQVTWASTVTASAQISNAGGSEGLATAVGVGATTISATLTGVTGATTLTVTAAVLDSIVVTPATPSVASGRSQQFAATGTFSDGTTQILTTQVTWSTGDPTVAQISNAAGSQGLATTRLPGTTTISATLTGVTGTTDIIVTAAVLESISVAPTTATVGRGGKQQYIATGHFSDVTTQDLTTTVTWSSANAAIAQVSNAAGTQGQATGVALGATTITATSGTTAGSAAILVIAGPTVSTTSPADATSDVRTSTPIVITFDQAIAPATLTTQTTAGACSGTLQLSADNFTTCIAFAAATPAMNVANTVATATPSPKLLAFTTYRIRVLGTVTSAAGIPIGTDFTQATGFKTAGSCTARVVISQVYGGGGNSGSVFRNDFIELHNVGTTPVSLAGSAVQFISAAGTGTWAVQALPAVTVPGGGYFLIQEAVGGTLTALLPTPDFVPAAPFAIGQNNAKIALTPSLTPLTGTSCSAILALTTDLVGYGGASCFEGTAGAGATANTTSVQRNDGGCVDTNANNLDFTVAAPVPRNLATTSNVCSCTGSTTPGPAEGVSYLGDEEASSPVSVP